MPEAINPHPILRKHFGLFANVRPTRSYPDIGCLYDDIDLVIVRENNEGFQPDRNVVAGCGEFRPTEGVTISVRVITREGSRKVAEAALQIAQARRKRLTIVHKNTVFKLGCGMFVDHLVMHRANKRESIEQLGAQGEVLANLNAGDGGVDRRDGRGRRRRLRAPHLPRRPPGADRPRRRGHAPAAPTRLRLGPGALTFVNTAGRINEDHYP